MKPFEYLAPTSLDDLYSALQGDVRSAMLAGGTDVIIQLREGRREVDQLIDVKHIAELMTLEIESDGTLAIGAATPVCEIYEDESIRQNFPGLVDAASLIGGIAIQGRASLGGNICNASPASDSAPALMALGAQLVIGSGTGTRTLPVEDFFVGPGQNALAGDEILLQIRVPALTANSNSFFLRFIPRNEMDIAVVNCGARIELNAAGDSITDARVAVGAVAPTPLMVPSAAQALIGQAPTEEAFAAAGAAASAAATPITDMRGSAKQRTHLASVLTVRALRGALQRITEAS
jgi:CO/xanthine dehydrogenase FAD-binding subunit